MRDPILNFYALSVKAKPLTSLPNILTTSGIYTAFSLEAILSNKTNYLLTNGLTLAT